jgi:hypothetical protein
VRCCESGVTGDRKEGGVFVGKGAGSGGSDLLWM